MKLVACGFSMRAKFAIRFPHRTEHSRSGCLPRQYERPTEIESRTRYCRQLLPPCFLANRPSPIFFASCDRVAA
jgi:hypothetical protein